MRYSEMLDGRSEHLPVNELAGGARIRHIFLDIFVNGLQELNPSKCAPCSLKSLPCSLLTLAVSSNVEQAEAIIEWHPGWCCQAGLADSGLVKYWASLGFKMIPKSLVTVQPVTAPNLDRHESPNDTLGGERYMARVAKPAL